MPLTFLLCILDEVIPNDRIVYILIVFVKHCCSFGTSGYSAVHWLRSWVARWSMLSFTMGSYWLWRKHCYIIVCTDNCFRSWVYFSSSDLMILPFLSGNFQTSIWGQLVQHLVTYWILKHCKLFWPPRTALITSSHWRTFSSLWYIFLLCCRDLHNTSLTGEIQNLGSLQQLEKL